MVPSRRQARTLARGLGWFSIGLGVIELLTARPLSRAVGAPRRSGLVSLSGVRGIATGVGLLNARDPAPWMWARLAGDALDVATMASGIHRKPRLGATVALAAVTGVALLDLVTARRLSQPSTHAVGSQGWRSGFPLPADEMRGAALEDFTPPEDMRVPAALRPWTADGAEPPPGAHRRTPHDPA